MLLQSLVFSVSFELKVACAAVRAIGGLWPPEPGACCVEPLLLLSIYRPTYFLLYKLYIYIIVDVNT